jgi:hypothetical protein
MMTEVAVPETMVVWVNPVTKVFSMNDRLGTGTPGTPSTANGSRRSGRRLRIECYCVPLFLQ